MSDVQKKFYVLRAISGKENKVREYLEAELKNTDLGDYVSQVLIPTEKTYTVRNGKKVMKERAYLPGYVLVEATNARVGKWVKGPGKDLFDKIKEYLGDVPIILFI